MASILLSGVLKRPNGDLAVGDEIKFEHKSSTGDTVQTAECFVTIPPNGQYSVSIEYGIVNISYKAVTDEVFTNLGKATVNQDNPATNIPELLRATVPQTNQEMLEFQTVLANCIDAQNNAQQSADDAQQIVDGLDSFNYVSIKNNDLVPSSKGIVIGIQDYLASEIGAGSVLVTGYAGSSNNRMPGTAQLRSIVGGYDNFITSGPLEDGANSAGLACCIFSSQHSEIKNESNHCTISGGSYNIIDDGTYNTICGGTLNEIIGTYSTGGLQNNFVTGARNTCDGSNNIMAGADNNLKGFGSVTMGLQNQVGQSLGSDYCYVGGNGNTVERNYSSVFGFQNNVIREYGLTAGRSNESNGSYQLTTGRAALNDINYAVAHGFSQGDDLGKAQKVNYQLDRTTTDGTTQNMSSISQGLLGPSLVEDSMVTYSGTVRATDGIDMAVFDVEFAFLRSNSVTTIMYNNATTKGSSAGAGSWSSAFGGQNDGRLTVTGEASKSITWYADIEYLITPLTE